MLKLLLGHWQTHREPLPFVLTDDPLYCSHLTKSPFPEVYSVNRVNPIFEDEEDEIRSISSSIHLKRSLSEERRENETRASDDTGYSSKSLTTAGSLTDDVVSLEARHMSSDSDEGSQPEAVVVSADVHRVSYPEDVIVLPSSNSSDCSQTFSANSYFGGSSESSQDPFDSLTMPADNKANDEYRKSEVDKSSAAVRERLQKLLEKGNDRGSDETFLDSLEAKPSQELNIEKSKHDLMKSLTRALNSKVPNQGNTSNESVTRTDSALDMNAKSLDRKSSSSSTSPKTLHFSVAKPLTNGITRQDASSSSSSSSNYAKPRKYVPRAAKNKDYKRESLSSTQESSDSKESHKCKLCENAYRPLAFHQLLPGHWSYDNVYLPQLPHGMCCSCVHRHSFPHSNEDDVFYPLYYPPDIARARHSWAPYPNTQILLEKQHQEKNQSKESSEKKETPRQSPDGTSRETDSTDSGQLKKSVPERRSLREPKKCKCEHCLETVLDKDKPHVPAHACPCCYAPHRRVKFASDTNLSQHKHMHPPPIRIGKDVDKLINGEPINAAFVMKLPHLNGHVLNGGQLSKENGSKAKKVPPLVPRGLKEPIKMDELYSTYPINFREWEAHYRRSYLQKRRKRALNMIGMAIGIILVVGIAVALTFVFLRIKRPT